MMSLLTGSRVSRTPKRRVPAHWRYVCTVALLLMSLPLWAAPRDVIVLIDNSGSMRQNDPTFALKGALTKFFANLPADNRAGVLIFDQKVSYPVPLVAVDAALQDAVKDSLTKVDYRGQYTNIPAAMERAIYELKTDGRKDAAKIVVFMTDGIVDTGNPSVDVEKAKWLRDELAADAADNGIRIFGIAFTENADFFLIQSLAKKTSGEYFRALKPADLDGAFTKVEERLGAAPSASAPPTALPADAAPALAAAAVPGVDPCLAALSADDRDAIEQMAKAASTTAEQLCTEMNNTPAGQPVVTPAPAPEPEVDSTTGVALVAGSALILLLAAGVLVFILIKRRTATPAAAELGHKRAAPAAAAPPRVPAAFIKDINGLTSEPAVQLTAKPMMIGRIAGTDPDHADYFVVEMPTIGRRHALIRYRDFCFWIADQGSVNGTFLNGDRIEGERQLKHGDRVRFHKYEFEFSMPEMDDAGHTLFADPLNRTMVGDLDTMVGTAAVMASSVAAADAIARAGADHDDDDDDAEFVSLDGGGGDADEAEAATVLPINLRSGILSGTAARADAEFDAEASAFFDEDDLAVTASPHSSTVIERGPMLRIDDEGGDDFNEDTMQMPAVVLVPRDSAGEEEFSESQTLLPVSPAAAGQTQGVDISLDVFMDTDSFDEQGPGTADLDDNATLMPEQVPDRPLAIDDVFDVTAEGTIAPVRPGDDDEDDDHDRTTILR